MALHNGILEQLIEQRSPATKMRPQGDADIRTRRELIGWVLEHFKQSIKTCSKSLLKSYKILENIGENGLLQLFKLGCGLLFIL